MFTEAEIRESLHVAANLAGGVRRFAAEIGVSPSYVSDVLNGRRAPGPPFLKRLGMRKVVLYKKESV